MSLSMSPMPVNSWQEAYASTIATVRQYLIASARAPIAKPATPQAPWGSPLSIMQGLGETISVLQHASQSGYYGKGTHFSTWA